MAHDLAVQLGDEGSELVLSSDELLGREGQWPPEGIAALRLLLGEDFDQPRDVLNSTLADRDPAQRGTRKRMAG